LLIVVGLAISAPPSCWCAPDNHFGLLLHPLFLHAHGDAHSPGPLGDDEFKGVDLVGATTVDEAPGISASATGAETHHAFAGLLLPLLLAAMLLEASRRIALADSQPEQRALAPPIPPPRLLPSIAWAPS
jgi:hypothetical protein